MYILKKNQFKLFFFKKIKNNYLPNYLTSTQFSIPLFPDIQFFIQIMALAVSGSNLFLELTLLGLLNNP